MKTEQEIEKQKQYIEKVKEINQGKNLKYYILTMGCQLNENDSEKLCGMVEEMGYKPTDDYKEAIANCEKVCKCINLHTFELPD